VLCVSRKCATLHVLKVDHKNLDFTRYTLR